MAYFLGRSMLPENDAAALKRPHLLAGPYCHDGSKHYYKVVLMNCHLRQSGCLSRSNDPTIDQIEGIGNSGELPNAATRSEEHTSELQSLMRISYAVFCLKKKTQSQNNN